MTGSSDVPDSAGGEEPECLLPPCSHSRAGVGPRLRVGQWGHTQPPHPAPRRLPFTPSVGALGIICGSLLLGSVNLGWGQGLCYSSSSVSSLGSPPAPTFVVALLGGDCS